MEKEKPNAMSWSPLVSSSYGRLVRFAITYPCKHYGIIIVADSLDDAEARYQSQHHEAGGQAEHNNGDRQRLRGATLPIEYVHFRAVRHPDNC